jgi:hypothetical protein
LDVLYGTCSVESDPELVAAPVEQFVRKVCGHDRRPFRVRPGVDRVRVETPSLRGTRLSVLRRLTVLLLLAISFLLAVRPISDAEIWWHLKAGELMLFEGFFPITQDVLSHTHEGTPWTNVPWLHQAISAAAVRAGGFELLIWLEALLCTVAVGGTLATASALRRFGEAVRWEDAGGTPQADAAPRAKSQVLPGWAFPAVAYFLVGLWSAEQRFQQRPETWTFLCGSWMIFCLVRARLCSHRWLVGVVLLQLLWCNTHGAFALGWVAAASFAGGEVAEAAYRRFWLRAPWRREGRPFYLRGWGLGAAAVVLVSLANPRGWVGASYPLHLFDVLVGEGYRELQTWVVEAAPLLKVDPLPLDVWLLLGSVVVTALALIGFDHVQYRRGGPPATAILGLGYLGLLPAVLYVAVAAVRNVPLFFFFGTAVGLVCLDGLARGLSARGSRASPLAETVASLLLGCAAYGLVGSGVLAGGWGVGYPPGVGVRPGVALDGAVRFIRENRIRGPWFNNILAGDYFVYRLGPEYKAFIDGRLAEVYLAKDRSFFRRYISVLHGSADFSSFAGAYGVTAALISLQEIGSDALVEQLRTLRGWAPVYLDGFSVIFLKRVPAHRELIRRHALPPPGSAAGSPLAPLTLPEPAALSSSVMSLLCLGCSWRPEAQDLGVVEARSLLMMGYEDHAAAVVDGLVAAGRDDPDLWDLRGMLLVRRLPPRVLEVPLEDRPWGTADPETLAEIASLFSRVLRARPTDPTALSGAALVHLLREEPEEGYALLQRALEDRPWARAERFRAAVAAERAGYRAESPERQATWWQEAAHHYEELQREGLAVDGRLALLYARIGELARARELALAALDQGVPPRVRRLLRERILDPPAREPQHR